MLHSLADKLSGATWLAKVGRVLLVVFWLTTARAQQTSSHDITPYLEQLPTQREETWFQQQLREYRTFRHLELAYRLMSEGHLQEARSELEKYLAIDPQDLRVRTTYMVLLHRMKDYPEVVRQADMLLQAEPHFVPALLYRGLVRLSQQQISAAIQDFKAVAAVAGVQREDRIFALETLAELALKQEMYADALAALEALSKDKQDFSVYFRQGLALEKLGRLAEAFAAYQRALTLVRSSTDRTLALNTLADLALKQEMYSDALSALEALLKEKADFRGYFRQGIVLEGLGRLEEAVAAYQHAVDLTQNPEEQFSAYRALSEVAKKREDWEGAQQALLSAHQLRPQNPEPLRELGKLAYAQNDYPEAARWTRQALAISPNLQDREFLANILYSLEDYPAAVQQLNRLLREVRTRTDRHRIYLALGNAYTKLGRTSEAAEAFREAARIGIDIETWSALIDAAEREGRLSEAIAYSRQIVQRYPSAQTHLQLGILLAKAGEGTEALQHLEQAEQSNPTSSLRAEIQKQKGLVYYALGRYAEARHALESSAALNPQDPSLYAALGETSIKLGAYPDAINYLNRALALEPTPALRRSLALAHSEAGNIDEAIADYRRLLEGLPRQSEDAPEILLSIANLESRQGNHLQAATVFLEAFERGGVSQWSALVSAATSFALAERWRDAAQVNLRLLALAIPAPQRAETLERLGIIYTQLQEYDRAADAFRQTIEGGREGWEIRLNFGIVLSKLGRWDEAVENFQRSAQENRTPVSLIYLGSAYQGTKKIGLAIHYLEEALAGVGQLEKADQRNLYSTLGYLYAEECEYARAAEVWSQSLALQPDPTIAFALGRMQRLLGRVDEARKTLEVLDPASFPPSQQADRWDELAQIYKKQDQFDKAIEAQAKANALEPKADRYYQLGLLKVAQKRLDEAIPNFQEAVAREPGDSRYAVALGYALKDKNHFEEAARFFEAALKQEPDYLSLYEDLGYIDMRLANNSAAKKWFQQAIDNQSLRPVHSPEEEEKLRLDIDRMRREVAKLSRQYNFTFYLAPSSANRRLAAVPGGLGGGVLPAQGGAEFSWQPPVLGLRNERIFEIFGRVLWNIEPGTFDFQKESFQGGAGIRYKPLRTQSLVFGVERLLKIGDGAINNWLLRNLYSWSYGYDLQLDRSLWDYTTFYTDLAYFAQKPRSWAGYSEARQGITFRAGDAFLFTPHIIADVRHQNPGIPISSYWEGGGGLSLKFLFNQTRYRAPRSNSELLLHYKAGSFLRGGGPEGRRFSGWVVTWVFQF